MASRTWKPNVTVAAVIARDGRFLLVEEMADSGMVLNQPAGHLEPGESLPEACAREVLEETSHAFTPTYLIGVYLWRSNDREANESVTYLRFAFAGEIGAQEPGRALDHGIVRTLWLTADEIRAREAVHRSPLVMRCVEDHLLGQRYPLDLLHAATPVH
jgi:8-oxo-dGTP pyrophosphatase MutT (NUDIX family)